MGNELILAEAAGLQPSALVSLYKVDVSTLGGGILNLAPYMQGQAQTVFWQGVEYTGYPIEFTGHEFKGQGTTPRPTVRFANVGGVFTSLCLNYNNLAGATFTRKRTFARFLDGQPDADPTAALPDDVFEFDRKSYEDRNWVEFELASALEVDGVMLPRRQVMSSMCAWIYRSPECSFAAKVVVGTKDNQRIAIRPGTSSNRTWNAADVAASGHVDRGEWDPAFTYHYPDVAFRQITPRVKRYFLARNDAVGANLNKQPPNTDFWIEDLCSLTLRGCTLRYGTGPKPFGGFPGTHKVQSA